jgi:hypothetical protein
VRGPRLPDVFAARGREPLPRGTRRIRVTWTLISMGFVASVGAGAAIGAVGYLVAVLVILAGAGPQDWSAAEALAEGAGTALVAAVCMRATRALIVLWLQEEDADAAASGPDGRYGAEL